MAIIWTDVTAHASELSTIAVGAQNDILAHVNEVLDTALFSVNSLKLARIYLAAHFGASLQTAAGGTAGPVVGRGQGDMSISYGFVASGASAAAYDTTGYGRTYLALVKGTVARGGLVL